MAGAGAPAVVHKAADRLGHRLRGEPGPALVLRPEDAYRWVRGSALGDAATVTVVTGATPEDVLVAFGADPQRPEPLQVLAAELGIDPWVAVLPVDGVVLAVELNGWQGSLDPVLRPASTGGRAASMYWNVNALTRLCFARAGTVLAAWEPPPPAHVADAEVRAAVDGLGLDDYRDRMEKGLAAVERFTGRGPRPADASGSRRRASGTGSCRGCRTCGPSSGWRTGRGAGPPPPRSARTPSTW
ncbi:hypothetical protein BJF78_25900 [Pseudonocardia sp. CNS-139]|nr:hypothetical protein BJF78_25900 [Pseudonocardia sp. CNS-139]